MEKELREHRSGLRHREMEEFKARLAAFIKSERESEGT